MAIEAAAASESIAGAIAICPAGPEHLLRGLRAGTPGDANRPGSAESRSRPGSPSTTCAERSS